MLRSDYVDYLEKLSELIEEYIEDIKSYDDNSQAYGDIDIYILEEDMRDNLEIID